MLETKASYDHGFAVVTTEGAADRVLLCSQPWSGTPKGVCAVYRNVDLSFSDGLAIASEAAVAAGDAHVRFTTEMAEVSFDPDTNELWIQPVIALDALADDSEFAAFAERTARGATSEP